MHRYLYTILTLYIPVAALAQSVPPSLCRVDETTYFSCPMKNGRTVSVCGSPNLVNDSSYLQYRYGRINQPPELLFPASPRTPRGLFEFSNAGMGAKASVRNLRFRIGEYTYVVFSYTAVYDRETAGVEVSRRSGKTTRIECKSDVHSRRRDIPSVFQVNEKHFYEIQNVGLPEVSQDELVY